nr:flagellar basal body protein [uncultured Oscillibacter sp.]
MGIGTFGSFTQARLAIYAAQTGISVTGNNISNINTPGYTRQRLNQVSLYAAGADRYYAEGDIRTGQGALVKSLSQIRSPYLDIRYRTESAKAGYMDSKLEVLNEIQRILDEVGAGDASEGEGGFGILGLDLEKLSAALNNLIDQTGHQEYDNTVRQICKNLIGKFNTYANQLETVQKNTVNQLKENVDKVNNYLTTIRSLNEEIRKSEIHGDPALELRDDRNRQIDELSELIDINVTYSEEIISGGVTVEKLTIRLDDANTDASVTTDESLLVDGVFSAQLSFGTPMLNEEYDPEKVDALKQELDAGNITQDEYDARYAELTSKYLKKNEDGTTTPVEDIRDATILTDGDNPLYSLMISELRNKVGDLHVDPQVYAEETVEFADLPAGLKFNPRTNQVLETVEDLPAKGDKTLTLYRRTLKPGTTNNPPTDADYTYTKQVYEHRIAKPVALDDNDLNGRIQALREQLTEAGEFTDRSIIDNFDEKAGSKRGIPYYQKTLDLLANQFAKIMNEANQGFLTDPAGNYITVGKNASGEEAGVPVTITGTDAAGAPALGADGKPITHTLNKNDTWDKLSQEIKNTIMAETGLTEQVITDQGLGSKEILDAYLKGQKYDANSGKLEPENDPAAWKENGKGIFTGGVLFSNDPKGDDPSGITAANISVSHTWDLTHLLVRDFTCPEGATEPASGASDNIRHFLYLVGDAKFDFVPTDLDACPNASSEPMFNGNFHQMWVNIGTVLGEDQDYATTMLETHYKNVLAIDTERDSVSSVDFNDEAMNLMMYAKSYNAACRLMTTIDSVLDKLINNTGMTT